MKRKLILALAVMSALGTASSGAFAQSDEEKQETKPELVAEGDEGFPKGSTPELIAAGDDTYPEGSTTPELIG